MSIIQSAISEMKRANFPDDEVQAMEKILSLFFDTWGSGEAASVMVPVLHRLIQGLLLSPLTGEENEWLDHGEMQGHPFYRKMRQNIRCGSILENTLLDGTIQFRDLDNPQWDGTFPYE